MIDIILNAFIFFITAVLVIFMFRKDGQWDIPRGKRAFRFYTVLSNCLCAAASLLMALTTLAGPVPRWVWTLKYIGTAAVTVTMLTVIFFLAPTFGKDWFNLLLKGASNVFMHLLTPLLALISFCLLEKRFVDVAIRYGAHPILVDRWKAVLDIKAYFEEIMGCSIYDCLPGVIENSFK